MKLAKLSLAAIVVAGLASSSFAADTLADAFKNGKVSGELKAWYFAKDDATNGNVDMFNTGVTLGYITDSLNGFSMGLTMQSNYAPFASTSAKPEYATTEYASGATLSEAYLAYTMKNTTVKIGRQFIATPLVSGSGSRMIKEAFEGAVVINTDLPQTTLVAGYVSKFQGRTSKIASTTVGDAPNFEKYAAFTGGVTGASFDGAYTALAINKSITNLTLTAQYALVNDVNKAASATVNGDVDVYYVEAGYVLPMSGFKLGFDANYRASKAASGLDTLALDGDYMAARISISELAGFGASFAVGTTDGTDSTIAGMGNGPTSYTSTQIYGTAKRMIPNTDSYLFAATYDFSKVGIAGLTALAQYGWTNQSGYVQLGTAKASTDYTNSAIGLTYAVPALKGLVTSLQYENQEEVTTSTAGVKAAAKNSDELWFKAGYSF